jgi:DNA-binding MarR family transcriptional regulator
MAAVARGFRVSERFVTGHPGVDPSCTEFVVNLLVAAGLLLDRMDTVLRPLGLTTSTFNVLQILGGDPDPLTPTELTTRYPLPLTTATMTGLLDTCRRRGWVLRTAHPTDRRRTLIELTGQGEAVRADAERHVLAAEPLWVEPTSRAARERVVSTLGGVIEHLHALRTGGRPTS